MAIQTVSDGWSEALKVARKKFIGTFDTGLRCNCKEANIKDHATEHDPNPPRKNIHEVRFGPHPDDYDRLQAFHPHHEYFCDKCGQEYRKDVIEGTRGYKPKETREPISKMPLMSKETTSAKRSKKK